LDFRLPDERARDRRTALHGQHGPRDETQRLVEESRKFHDFWIVIDGERRDEGHGNSIDIG
jgi:hypothetical protein